MAMMEISIVPLGTKKTSLSGYVAAVYKKIQKDAKGLQYELTAMGTIVQGPPKRLFQLAAKLSEVPFQQGAKRVYTVIKMDDRRDRKTTGAEKISSVMKKL